MFDDIIKGKVSDHEAPVPPDAWDNIVRKKKRRRLAFWWRGGSALLLLGLLIAGYYYKSWPEDTEKRQVTTNKQPGKAVQKLNDTGSSNTEVQEKKELTAREPNKKMASEKTEPSIDVNVHENNANKPGSSTRIRSKTTIDLTNAATEKENKNGNRRTKPSKKIKGRLYVKQTVPPGEAMAIANENANTNEMAVDETGDQEKITGEENKKATTATVTGNTAFSAVEEKKKQDTAKGIITAENENAAIKKQTTKNQWLLEASVMPLFTSSTTDQNIAFNRTFRIGNSNTVYNGRLLKTSIEPAIAFSVALKKEFNQKFSIGTGLQYLQLKENLSIEGKETNTIYTPVQRLANGQLVADTVVTVSEGTRSINAVHSYLQFSIPVFIQYSIIQKKQWSISAVGGMYINISSSYQNEINRNIAAPLLVAPAAGNDTHTGLDVFTGVRIGKTHGRKLEFFAMPSMRWNLTGINNSWLNTRMTQVAAGFGITYKVN